MIIERKQLTRDIAERIRAIRQEQYGQDAAALARELGIPEQTWRNYEDGVIMPAAIMLGFLELCGTDPCWMLHGKAKPPKGQASQLI
jgi:DNA-binding transcriptional regulator YiaG